MCSHANTQKTEWHVYVQIICLPKKKTPKYILNIYKQKNIRRHLEFGRLPIFLNNFSIQDASSRLPRPPAQWPQGPTGIPQTQNSWESI